MENATQVASQKRVYGVRDLNVFRVADDSSDCDLTADIGHTHTEREGERERETNNKSSSLAYRVVISKNEDFSMYRYLR